MSALDGVLRAVGGLKNRGGDTLVGKFAVWSSSRLLGIGVAVAVWWYLALVFPRNLLPGPFETMALSFDLVRTGVVWPHMSATFGSVLVAFLLALLLASVLGIVMGTTRYGTNFFTPYVSIGLTIPGIAWAATFFIVFGYDTMFANVGFAPVVTTTMAVTPYLTLNIWKGVESIDTELLDMANGFDVSKRRQLRHIVLPNIAPHLFAAFRFGLAISWKVVTVAEIFAANQGIGHMLIHNYEVYQYEEAWAWAATFLLVILVIEYGVFSPLEERVFRWRSEPDISKIG